MKQQRITTTKAVTSALLFVLFLSFSSCGNKQVSSNKEKETEVKQPTIGLHEAIFMGNLPAISQHIDAGSDLNVKDQYGSTPLIVAATFNKIDAAKLLIDGGADVNSTSNDGSTPLHTAAFYCRVEIVEALLSKNADKSIRNSYGSTALESISGPFEDVKAIYDQISKDLGPFGLKLDYEYLETTRPVIAEMLNK